MPTDPRCIQRTLAMLQDDSEHGVRLVSRFQSLGIWTGPGVGTEDDALAARLRRDSRAIDDDLTNLLSVVLRLELDRGRRDEGSLPWPLWLHFSRLDVEAFFVLGRSAADHAAGLLAELSRAPKSASRSFSGLRKQSKSTKGQAHLGDEVRDIVEGCDWFEEFKGWRELIVHEGAQTLTFPEAGQLLFQIYRGPHSGVVVPGIMYNDNVVDLARFISTYFASVLCMLEDIAELTYARLKAPYIDGWRIHPGLCVLRDWMTAFVDTATRERAGSALNSDLSVQTNGPEEHK